MLDDLLAQDPDIQRILAESYAKGYAKGLAKAYAEEFAKGEIKGLRGAMISVIRGRFPAMIGLAQKKAAQINSPDALDYLILLLATTPDEAMVHWLLSQPDD